MSLKREALRFPFFFTLLEIHALPVGGLPALLQI